MREIKFRAWHPSGGYDEGKMKMTYWNLGDGLDNSVFFKSAKELMQFTGLHDRNGKEIYEGDILQGISPGGFIRYKVQEKILGWNIIPINKNFDKDLYERYGVVEVIGNIYENPELTK